MNETIAALVAEVAEDTTVIGSAVALLDGITELLKDAVSTGDMAAVSKAVEDLAAGRQALADAVVRDTPAAP